MRSQGLGKNYAWLSLNEVKHVCSLVEGVAWRGSNQRYPRNSCSGSSRFSRSLLPAVAIESLLAGGWALPLHPHPANRSAYPFKIWPEKSTPAGKGLSSSLIEIIQKIQVVA